MILKVWTTLFLTVLTFPSIAPGETTGATQSPILVIESAPPEEEAKECTPGKYDHHSVGARCAIGLFTSVVELVKLPGNILKLVSLGQQNISACNKSPEIKKGMLLVVEPLIKGGADSWMQYDCMQIMQMAKNLEDQGARDVMNKLRLQETVRRLMRHSPPQNETQRLVFQERLENVALTPEQQQFWDRKMARDEILGRAQRAALERTWNYAKQEWQCADVKDILSGACTVVADIALGGSLAIVGKAAAKGTRAAISSATQRAVTAGSRTRERLDGAVEGLRDRANAQTVARQPESASRDEIFDATFGNNISFADKADEMGLRFKDGNITSIDPRASELAAILHRLQSRYGVGIRSIENGLGRLQHGTNPRTGRTFLAIDAENLLDPRSTVEELLEVERRLRFSKRNGIYPDTEDNRLIVTNRSGPLAKRFADLKARYGVKPNLMRTDEPLGREGTNIRYNSEGTFEIHPDLLKPGQERRLQRELDLVQNNQMEALRGARQDLLMNHGIKVDRNGLLTLSKSHPDTQLSRILAKLEAQGIKVSTRPQDFGSGQAQSNGGAFARGSDNIVIRPEYLMESNRDFLKTLLNHEISHITTTRRAARGNLPPRTSRAYSGRSIEFVAVDTEIDKIPSIYSKYFRADEMESYSREANIGYRSGAQTHYAHRARTEAIRFADKQLMLLTRAKDVTPEIRTYTNGSDFTYKLPQNSGGHIEMTLRIRHPSNATPSAIRAQARRTILERIGIVERQAARLRARGQ